jgi:hypothetical protein
MGFGCRVAVIGLWCVACGSSERAPDGGGDAGTAGSGGSAGSGSGAGGKAQAGGGGQVAAGGAAGSSAGSSGAGGAAGAGGSGGASGSGTSGTGAFGMCPSGTTNHTPGSRIRGRWAVTDEGVRAWLGWFDNELEIDCEFMTIANGGVRCVPNNYDFSEEVYTDASCTMAAYTRGRQSECEFMDFVFQSLPGDCETPGGYVFYELGESVGAASEVYTLDGSECVPTTVPDSELFRRGPLIQPSRFQEGTSGELGGAGRLRDYGVSAPDGTRRLQNWWDTEFDEECYMYLAEDGALRCLPRGPRVDFFGDAACELPIFEPYTSCTPVEPSFATEYPDHDCPNDRYVLFTAGETYAGPRYEKTEASCLAAGPSEAPSHVAVPAPPEMFPSIDVSTDESAPGRLKPRYWTTSDGGCWFQGFWDSELGAECHFDGATDGQTRCIPGEGYQVLNVFSDAACSAPFPLVDVATCGTDSPPRFVLGSAGECRDTYAVWETGETLATSALPALWDNRGGTCQTVTLPGTSYVRLALVDPARLVAGEIRVE